MLYNSMAFSPRANYTDLATATCWRNLVPTVADRGVSRGQRGGSLTVVNLKFSRPEPLLFFEVAPHLSSQGLSGHRSRPTATQKIWSLRESNLGPLGLQPGNLTTRSQRWYSPVKSEIAFIFRAEGTEVSEWNREQVVQFFHSRPCENVKSLIIRDLRVTTTDKKRG
jgi:hypothetical protein